MIVGANTGSTIRLLPGKFLTADPIAVWVTQNGRLNGSAPGSTMGTGTLVIVTATPA